MSLRNFLIRLSKKAEKNWQSVNMGKSPVLIKAGWYITEFNIQENPQNISEIMVEEASGNVVGRSLIGFHSGHNRMLIYLPEGQITAYDEVLRFKHLSRIPSLEARARIWVICFRYLLDFFNFKSLFEILTIQFHKPFDLSTRLLKFSDFNNTNYLKEFEKWKRLEKLSGFYAWWYKDIKIAVLLESESQRQLLDEQMVKADAVLIAGQDTAWPSDCDYILPLKVNARLKKPAIIMLKQQIKRASTKPQLIYSDHDYAFEQEAQMVRREPVFKPDPSLVYLCCYNYIAPAVVFFKELAAKGLEQDIDIEQLFDTEQQYFLSLQAFQNIKSVAHIPEVLYSISDQHKTLTPEPEQSLIEWRHLQWQRNGFLENTLEGLNTLTVDPDWQDLPSVDMIIPTRDGLEILKPCIESIQNITDYPDYTIFIVDNGSEKQETKDYFQSLQKDPNIKVLEYPGEFNYSAINNFAIAQGQSDYIALVNNDIEVIHADWLKQMMAWAVQDNVGVVGAKLLYGNGDIQHAGVTIGLGHAAGHLHRQESGDSLGYQNRLVSVQNFMAVTGACLLTSRRLFESMGGLDEEQFKVAYNDIDYCLKLEKAGYEVIWTPQARLYHHESVSRGDDMSEKHIRRYFAELKILQKRWKTKYFVDKYYSKHLRIGDEGVYPRSFVKSES